MRSEVVSLVPPVDHADEAVLLDVPHHLVGHLIVLRFLLAPGFFDAVQDGIQPLGGEFIDGRSNLKFILLRQGLDLFEGVVVPVFAEWGDAALVDAFGAVRDDFLDVRAIDVAQAAAGGAVAVGAVEAECIRARFLVGDAVFGVHEVLGEGLHFVGVYVLDEQ